MANYIKKGDAVRLNEPLEVVEQKDANNKSFWLAQRHWDKKAKAPFGIFDTYTGIYMGTEYVPMHDRKGELGRTNKHYHCFFFNNARVYIDPKFVDIVACIDDALG